MDYLNNTFSNEDSDTDRLHAQGDFNFDQSEPENLSNFKRVLFRNELFGQYR